MRRIITTSMFLGCAVPFALLIAQQALLRVDPEGVSQFRAWWYYVWPTAVFLMAAIVSRIGAVASVIAQELAHAALRDQLGYAGGANVTGDQVKKLDAWGHEIMMAALRKTGACAALVSEEAPEPIEMAEGRGQHALVVACDPVDGSSNLDVNGTVGTIFSLRPSKGMPCRALHLSDANTVSAAMFHSACVPCR